MITALVFSHAAACYYTGPLRFPLHISWTQVISVLPSYSLGTVGVPPTSVMVRIKRAEMKRER